MKVFITCLLCLTSFFAVAQTTAENSNFVGKLHLPKQSKIVVETVVLPDKVLYALSFPKFSRGECVGFYVLNTTRQQKDVILAESKKTDLVLFCDADENMIGYTTQKLYDKIIDVSKSKEL